MARNSSGTHSLPAGNPVASGTNVSSSWANNTMTDLSTAMTDSFDRNGRGSMLAPIKAFSGTEALPGISWASETTTGWYYAGAGDVRFSLSASDLFRFNAGTVSIWDGSAWNAIQAAGDTVSTDTISEATAGAGVTVDGTLIKDAGLTATGVITGTGGIVTDTITEETGDAGVTIEGVVLKDLGITATGDIDFSGASLVSLGTLDSVDINSGAIDGTAIGATSASTGAFTTISGTLTGNVTGNVTGNIDGTVGASTPATGAFTTISTTGALTFGAEVVETVFAIPSSTTPELDPADGTIQTWTLTGNSTPTSVISAGESITLKILDGTAYTITWPTMEWIGGSAPTLDTTNDNWVVLWNVAGTLYGTLVGASS